MITPMQQHKNGISIEQTIITWLAGIILRNAPPWPDQPDPELEEKIFQTGMEHGVLALCSYQLYHTNTNFPQMFIDAFKNAERQAAVTELLLKREIKAVLECLQAENIETLLLKGTPLAYSLYEQPYHRPRCDTDLLFPDKDTAKQAWSAIRDMGYERPNAVSGDLISHEFSCTRNDRYRVQHCLDFHWKLSNNHSFARTFSFDELMQNAVRVQALHQAHAPNPVHALLFACMHRLSHSTNGMADRLIWLYDIHLLARSLSSDQWQALVELAIKKRIPAILLMGLQATADKYATEIPRDILNKLEHAPTTEQFAPKTWQTRGHTDLANLRSLDSQRDRIRFIYEHLFPKPDYMYKKYRTRKKLLLPCLYFLRIMQGVPKMFR